MSKSEQKPVRLSLGPPYSNCNETLDYRQVNCNDECFNKAISDRSDDA